MENFNYAPTCVLAAVKIAHVYLLKFVMGV